MRKSLFLRNTVLFLVTVSPTAVCAQFQQPTAAELQMTSDPKAPGAAAVYLDVNENYELDAAVDTFYARIKVLTEKGKELATVEIPYWKGCEKVALLKGRTIHSDGTSFRLPRNPTIAGREDYGRADRAQSLRPAQCGGGKVLEYHYDMRSRLAMLRPSIVEMQKSTSSIRHLRLRSTRSAGLTVKPHGLLVDENGNAATRALMLAEPSAPGASFSE